MFDRIDAVMFYVSDIEKAKKFYIQLLGLQVIDDQGEFVSLKVSQNDTCKLSLNAMHLKGQHPGLQTTILRTSDIDAVYKKLKDEVIVVFPLSQQPWGKTFIFADPDGNKIEVLQ